MSDVEVAANPFVGLRPFFIDDSLYFFGREQQTAELLEILHQHRFVGVVGSSGSGKSSLVRAGLLPALLGGLLVEDRDRWRIVQVKPGDAPIGNLAAGLLEAMGETSSPEARTLERTIRDEHTEAVVTFLTPRLESNANLFVLVDQFEEIFAFRGLDRDEDAAGGAPAVLQERARRKSEAADFVDLIMGLATIRGLPIYVALTMRTDFLGDCDLFYGFPEALNRGRYLVPRMTRQQLGKAIEGPARLADARVAPRLLDKLLNDLGDRFDRLPVLQHALMRTWDAWRQEGGAGLIDIRHFEAAGGLEGALDKDAESALAGLDAKVTARVFKRLTTTDVSRRRVRSPARISELMAASSADRGTVEAIVHRFEEDGRSFVHTSSDGKPDDPRVDISHESLIRQWNRLRNWVDEERNSRERYRELVARARKWNGREAALLSELELEPYTKWQAEEAPSAGWAGRYSVTDDDFDLALSYIAESQAAVYDALAEAELQRRWRYWNVGLVAIEIVVGLVLARSFRLLANLSPKAPSPSPSGLLEKPSPKTLSRDSAQDFAALRGQVGDVGDTIFSLEWLEVILFVGVWVGVCFAVNRYAAQRIHRLIDLPRIRRRVEALGGRAPLMVEIEHERQVLEIPQSAFASTLRRLGGGLIDGVVLLVLVILGLVIRMVFLDYFPLLFLSRFLPEFLNDFLYLFFYQYLDWAWAAFVIASIWLYGTLQITSTRQATLGMRAVGIFRTDLQGRRLSFGRASCLWLYRFLSTLPYGLGFWIQPFTRKRQAFHDWLAGSVVLRRQLTPVVPG
jgi:uncharacterized RDD family membrane protein YckC